MPYDTDDQSVEASLASEMYEFSVNGTVVHRITSREVPVTYDGHSWLPGNVRRNLLSQSTQDEPGELLIDLPISDEFVASYAYTIPARSMTCRVIRRQSVSGEARVIWQGRIGNFATKISGRDRRCTVRVPSKLFDVNAHQTPGRNFQLQCPHQLFDVNCNIPSGDYDQAATISAISANGKVLTVSTVGGHPDQWFRRGKIVRDADGEKRNIVGQVGTAVEIDYPFRTLATSNAMTLFAGCDKLPVTCRDKFSNIDNFGGHPNVPTAHPWLPGGITAL